jgi:hypothetical protein
MLERQRRDARFALAAHCDRVGFHRNLNSRQYATEDKAMTARERKLLRMVMAPWMKIGVLPTFSEWCAAVDELYPAKN